MFRRCGFRAFDWNFTQKKLKKKKKRVAQTTARTDGRHKITNNRKQDKTKNTQIYAEWTPHKMRLIIHIISIKGQFKKTTTLFNPSSKNVFVKNLYYYYIIFLNSAFPTSCVYLEVTSQPASLWHRLFPHFAPFCHILPELQWRDSSYLTGWLTYLGLTPQLTRTHKHTKGHIHWRWLRGRAKKYINLPWSLSEETLLKHFMNTTALTLWVLGAAYKVFVQYSITTK